jgi:HEAT repeat protein
VRAVSFVLVTLVAAIAAERLVAENAGNLRTILFRQSVAIREGRAVDVRGGVAGTRPADYFPTGRRTVDLISALGNRDPDVRNRAAEALGDQRDPLAVPALAAALHDTDPGVRWKAAEALGRTGEVATGVLSEALHDTDPDVRWKAAVALGESGSEAAIAPLVHALSDPDTFVRSRVARALSRYRDAALQPALTAMTAEDPLLRAGAAVALGEIGGENAIHALIHAFGDPDPSVRKIAESAVALQGEKAIVPLIAALAEEKVRDAAATALAHIGRPAVQPLVQALTGSGPGVRDGAEHALGLMKEPAALRALIAYRDREKCTGNGRPEDSR